MKSLYGMLLLVLCFSGAHADVYRVDADSTSPNPNGASWTSAFSSIRDAVQAAHQAGGGEVWVAEGTYTGSAGNPTDSGGAAAGDTSLILLEGVHVYGGFSGVESNREERNWQTHPAIIDGQNVRRGVFSSGIAYGEATLDGFTVRRGHALEFGGGLYNDQSAPYIANCRFENNHAALHGGGVFNYKSPALLFAGRSLYDTEIAEQAGLDLIPAFSGVVFINNSATYAGGGLYSDADFLVFERCTFVANRAGVGGGMYDKGGKSEFFRCIFQGNSATDAGAGYCYEGNSTSEFTNCQLNHNDAATAGGAIYSDGYHVSLMHSTVAENSAPLGGGVYGARAYTLSLNSIAYDNGASNIDDIANAPFSLLGSCVEFAAADPAQGVINVDPLFTQPNLGFFGLAAASPALDTGISGWAKVNDDLNGAARPQGPEVDMGALEDHTQPATMDIDGDTIDDFWEMLYFGSLSTDGSGDSDGDGLSDFDEFEQGTAPNDSDSDNDGIPDGTEVGAGTDPLDADSVVSDVYVDGASGNDDTGVGTQTSPWATVAHAVATVVGTATNTVSIHVAEGVYTALNAAGGALNLDSHEHLFGGYEATGWTRDVLEHETILDASVASNGNPARNVVVFDTIVDARLDGFTVTGAYTDPNDYTTQDTGGIFAKNLDSSSSISNCQIIDNHTNGHGSGGILLLNASPTVKDCNIAANYSHGEGGGIGIRGNSYPEIEKCFIGGNEGRFGGGGVVIRDAANAQITNCVISANTAGNFWGGGIFFNGGGATVSNSTIAHNDADTRCGGGVAVMASSVRLLNVIFAENDHHAIADFSDGSGLVLENCLFDSNPAGDYYRYSNTAPLYYDGAATLNSVLPLADGNVDGPVLFVPANERVFTADSSYNPATNSTTFTDASASFVPGALRGKLVALSDDNMYQFLVLGNTSTTLEVLGDQSYWPAVGERYALIDYHLEVGSAAIDMGRDTSAPADGGVTIDLDGIARGFDGDSLGAVTADGSDYDIGAYESDTPAIVDAITVIAPNGGELITRGSLQAITWSSTGNVGANVRIVARRGTSTGTIVASTPNDGNYAWLVPATYPLGNNFVLEISSVTAPTIFDASDAFFTIQATAPPAGTITVVSPNGGESYLQGATLPISWSSTGTSGANVEIIARSAGQSFTLAASTANDGGFDWTIPAGQAVGTDYTIEVRSVSLPAIGDFSNAAFSIGSPPPLPSITVLSPNGGETLVRNTVVDIAWSSTGDIGANVRIIARRGTSSGTVVASTPNDGNYAWLVPANYPLGTGFTLEISSLSAPAILDATNASFTIAATAPVGTITVLSPNGGESFLAGATIPITWSSSGNTGTDVQIIVHGGGQNLTLAATTSNDGAFDWLVPTGQLPATDYTIEVRSLAFPAVGDSSNAAFTIASAPPVTAITVISPNGGETLVRNTLVEIRWSSSGDVGANVRIIARRGTSSGTVVSTTPNDGSYAWLVPATYPLGTGFTLEISSLSTPSILDTSNASFTIAATAPVGGTLTVLSPNGGESFLAGATAPITWSSTGDTGTQVQILAHGAGQSFTLAATTENDGIFDWAIPVGQTLGTNYTIEVRSLAFPAVGDSSNAAFTVAALPPAASITVISPNGGENIARASTVQINWSSTGNVGANVRIIARKGTSTGTIVSNTANDGNFAWTVPATFPLGPGMTIEISSIATPSILDTCDATFTVTP